MKTNVEKEFLVLIDEHFSPGHLLHSIINRNKVKMSDRCLPNMGRKVANHNNKVLRNVTNPIP